MGSGEGRPGLAPGSGVGQPQDQLQETEEARGAGLWLGWRAVVAPGYAGQRQRQEGL